MKTKTKKTNTLIGRGVRIDFHTWTQRTDVPQPRADFLNEILGTRRGLAKFDGQRGEIVDFSSGDDGETYHVLINGRVEKFLTYDFTVITDARPDRTEEALERIAKALETLAEWRTEHWES